MRILVATDVTARGGVDGYVRDLASSVLDAGHECTVALEVTTGSTLRDEKWHETAHLIPLYHRRHDEETLRSSAGELLDEVEPDGVHIACGSPMSCLVLREVVSERGLPLVITEQMIRDDLTLSGRDAGRIRAVYLHARLVIFVSAGNRAVLDRVVGLRGVQTLLVYNAVDVARVESAAVRARAETSPGGAGRGARIMCAARYAPEKSLDVLVRAVALLPAGVVASLDLYGEGAEEGAIATLVKEMGLESVVQLPGWALDVHAEMGRHDLFVLPSVAEGMPYALLEAMAAGIPIVVTDAPGSVEALGGLESASDTDQAAGEIVPRGDANALAAAITRVLQDSDVGARRAALARARVRAHHDLGRQMRRTVAVWTDEQFDDLAHCGRPAG